MRKSAPLFCALLLSLSARRAWIEIGHSIHVHSRNSVALRKESVDRNRFRDVCQSSKLLVALRKESVDRNVKWQQGEVSYGVALRKESVDRNASKPRRVLKCDSRSPQGERG